MKQLNLFKRIIFLDWHGVLSQDPFWTSIVNNNKHQLHGRMEINLKLVFSDKNVVNNWMRGDLSTNDIIRGMDIKRDGRFNENFLTKRLHDDCAQMRINVQLLHALRKFRPGVMVVLATDNMDCFAETFNRLRGGRNLRYVRKDILQHWAHFCDDIICSSEEKALKSEDPCGFFGPRLKEYGLAFSDAFLIDDRADNCNSFRAQGGNAVQWKMDENDVEIVTAEISRWLNNRRSEHTDR